MKETPSMYQAMAEMVMRILKAEVKYTPQPDDQRYVGEWIYERCKDRAAEAELRIMLGDYDPAAQKSLNWIGTTNISNWYLYHYFLSGDVGTYVDYGLTLPLLRKWVDRCNGAPIPETWEKY